MKTAVEQLGIAFRQWQKEWDNFEETRKNKPKSFDEFIKPFLEIEKQQIIDAVAQYEIKHNKVLSEQGILNVVNKAEQYYNETFKK